MWLHINISTSFQAALIDVEWGSSAPNLVQVFGYGAHQPDLGSGAAEFASQWLVRLSLHLGDARSNTSYGAELVALWLPICLEKCLYGISEQPW